MTIRENLKSSETWARGFHILLFAVLYSVAEFVLWVIVVFQFGSNLFTAKPNERLLGFSSSLNRYIYQVLQYLTYRSDIRPFPFMDWPDEEPAEEIQDDEEQPLSPPEDETEGEDKG